MVSEKTHCSNLNKRWYKRARESQFAHYHAEKHFTRLNYILGIPVVVLTTFVGTSVFASLQIDLAAETKIFVGLVSVLAAVLAGLQTFLGLAEIAEKHHSAAAQYGAIRRELELLEEKDTAMQDPCYSTLVSVKDKFDRLAVETPPISTNIWKKIERMTDQQYSEKDK